MTEPQPIELYKVKAGDTIHVRRVENAGTEDEIVSTIQGVASELGSSGSICFRGSCLSYLHDEKNTITLLHRPPTRRRITFDELRNWRAVPIGTKIEFVTNTGEAREVKISGRYQSAEDWVICSATNNNICLSNIKEETLFVIEGWVEKIVQEEVEKRTGELRAEVERLKRTISNMEEDL